MNAVKQPAAKPSLGVRWLCRGAEFAAPLSLLAAVALQFDQEARNYWQSRFDGYGGLPIGPGDAFLWSSLTVLAWVVLVPLMRPLTAEVHTPRPLQSRFLVCALLAGSWAWLVISVAYWRGSSLEVQHWLPIALLAWAVYARLGWSAPRTVAAAPDCAKCGYSLAGLRPGSRCPECGN